MLFTGRGDDGTTKTLGKEKARISKSSPVTEALGSLDELNSFIGFVKVKAAADSFVEPLLREIQEALFVIQAELAGAKKYVTRDTVRRVETIINDIERQLPPITGFTIAGGTELSTLLDTARTVSRRAERRVIAATETGSFVTSSSRAFLNRLSSLLFALARLANHDSRISEPSPHY